MVKIPLQRVTFPFALGFVPFNELDSLSRRLLSLSTSHFPFRARICPFQRTGFPFATTFFPFDESLSLSRRLFSLSTSHFPFRDNFCPFHSVIKKGTAPRCDSFSFYLNKLIVAMIIGIPNTSIKNAPTIGTIKNAF